MASGTAIIEQQGTTLWRSLRRFWCRHRHTVITPKTGGMPAHVVCASCGWREPVMASAPQATRTWDSTRDEARYEREKQRRIAAEAQRQIAVALRATPNPRVARPRREREINLVDLKRPLAG
ncbi:MAG TPA: hypothetical protein VG736_08045 [Vicinamibacterales bacterium]|jgi:hypothetical protein|nr:hypothetical protein [Vicinamibacterales bacterium]